MLHRFLADCTVLLHLAFVLFAVFGGLLVLRWRWVAWLHVPAAIWAAAIEFCGWICPLTPLENRLRLAGGETGYDSSFVERYVLPVLYPEDLTRPIQVVLALLVLGLNAAIYGRILLKRQPRPPSAEKSSATRETR
jgi:hypothetical protein